MVERKEDTPQRLANRKYEEKHREERKAASTNFQTMIPRKEYEEIDSFLKENEITKVQLIMAGYNALQQQKYPDKFKKNK